MQSPNNKADMNDHMCVLVYPVSKPVSRLQIGAVSATVNH